MLIVCHCQQILESNTSMLTQWFKRRHNCCSGYKNCVNWFFLISIKGNPSETSDESVSVTSYCTYKYEGVSISFRTGLLERELQMVQLSATRCSCIAILRVSLVSFATITLCVASERIIPKVSLYFVVDSVRKRLDTSTHVGLFLQRSIPQQNHVSYLCFKESFFFPLP
jgi:hypothetical protein